MGEAMGVEEDGGTFGTEAGRYDVATGRPGTGRLKLE
jgi:hypothetical protein